MLVGVADLFARGPREHRSEPASEERTGVRPADLTSWRAALSAAPPELAARVGADLLARWGERHRHYHTVSHLAVVLAVVEEQHGHAADLDAVRLAAWYHDVIYDPHRVDNEEASALLAEAALPPLGVPAARVAEVARLVRLTASHDPAPGDRNGELLTDADLAVLASPPEGYAAYTAAVRREYAHVPDPLFATGRAAVLHNLLALPTLFHVPALRERWEDVARANLTRELQVLRTTPIASF
jgi:predicted metal-dependent HD superfamily phosphohydrolase